MQERGAGPALTERHGRARRVPLLAVAALAVFTLDQLTKRWALHRLTRGDIHVVWTLRLSLARNTGVAFSVGRNLGAVIPLAAIVVVFVMLWVGRGITSRAGAVALGMVLGGALGNLTDRMLRDGSGFLGGSVVDFIDLRWWPVFNIADIGVVGGAILLMLVSAREP
jgi:signal peptidase II